ncbi:bifunctional 2-C-methyl-D-erythritol 4-phosphate cytidylyltransferase/2-C-methyl-D-erythritol 2,4-cyclodiphosphate synthase [Parerythrobacter lacustris]|uniref:Bifunctional enzyme IspD/IspF n=1 Tax=Parerythrobacter lacustris TaxID=2969984 RepID=A0ABT1XQ48_9SPHN|nr:bifunctional 2-C-methyl-D-erythritol 4-phosphate cytidylyltransferase/2-C-methyl-D-erythritol 2,4-cyclodiphosphate synthase [Parerythrobacter lacustris]MCR2833800.1 bifunctional 2-C-methyl-D-erythritol 4-phosphate cytidylyltransferase/2-C-methyl-D-erythritol 2,4-cyclodiphosphate synthase [Parerythrobacter lacustris]
MLDGAPPSSTRSPFDAIIVAGGQGLRAGQPMPKQFAIWRGKPVLAHSLSAFGESGAARIIVVVPDPADEMAQAIAQPFPMAALVKGGESRRESVLAGLEALESCPTGRVLIHDAARPGLRPAVIQRLLEALDGETGAIPVLPVVDSIAVARDGLMAGTARREELRRVQTPQAFRFGEILAAHRAWDITREAGDDAQVAQAAGHEVRLVEGDEALRKLTFAEDFSVTVPSVRIGTGFDVHRLGAGEELWLGGIRIDHSSGLVGHSDADVALHALTDAILGAVGAGDIGQHFSPVDPRWRGAASDQFLTHARQLAKTAGYRVGNVDITIICEAPKIGPHREAMVERIAQILEISPSQVSVKATTTERLGFTGRDEGIAAQAVATMLSGDA